MPTVVQAALSTGADSTPEQCAANVKALVRELTGGTVLAPANPDTSSTNIPVASTEAFDGDSDDFNFGKFGGRYVTYGAYHATPTLLSTPEWAKLHL
jgi:hypothetical protein